MKIDNDEPDYADDFNKATYDLAVKVAGAMKLFIINFMKTTILSLLIMLITIPQAYKKLSAFNGLGIIGCQFMLPSIVVTKGLDICSFFLGFGVMSSLTLGMLFVTLSIIYLIYCIYLLASDSNGGIKCSGMFITIIFSVNVFNYLIGYSSYISDNMIVYNKLCQ